MSSGFSLLSSIYKEFYKGFTKVLQNNQYIKSEKAQNEPFINNYFNKIINR